MISNFQWNRHFQKVSANKTFTHGQEQKKKKKKKGSAKKTFKKEKKKKKKKKQAMSLLHYAYIQSSVKSPLRVSKFAISRIFPFPFPLSTLSCLADSSCMVEAV